MKPEQHDFAVAMVFGQLLMISHAVLQKRPDEFVTDLYKLHQHLLQLLVDFTPEQKEAIHAEALQMVVDSISHEKARLVLANVLGELQGQTV